MFGIKATPRYLNNSVQVINDYINNYVVLMSGHWRRGWDECSTTSKHKFVFIQSWTMSKMLYKCYTNVLCLLGRDWACIHFSVDYDNDMHKFACFAQCCLSL